MKHYSCPETASENRVLNKMHTPILVNNMRATSKFEFVQNRGITRHVNNREF